MNRVSLAKVLASVAVFLGNPEILGMVVDESKALVKFPLGSSDTKKEAKTNPPALATALAENTIAPLPACRAAQENFTKAFNEFNEICAKAKLTSLSQDSSVSSSDNPCLVGLSTCLKQLEKEQPMSNNSLSNAITSQLQMLIPGMGNGAATGVAGMASQMGQKNPYTQEICKKSTMTKDQLLSKSEDLKRRLKDDVKAATDQQDKVSRDISDIKEKEENFQTKLAELHENDAEAANKLAKEMQSEEQQAMKAQIEREKAKAEIIVKYRQTLSQRAQMDRMKSRRTFDQAIRACVQNYLKNDPSRKSFSLKDRMALKTTCADDLHFNYNQGIENFNREVQDLEAQFKRLSLEENNAQVAAFTRKVQAEQRQIQMGQQAQMKQTQAKLQQMELQRKMLDTQMRAQQKNNQNWTETMTSRMELNQVTSAINNLGEPVEATPNEVFAKYQNAQSAYLQWRQQTPAADDQDCKVPPVCPPATASETSPMDIYCQLFFNEGKTEKGYRKLQDIKQGAK
ncbi:MAG: hypothetical protein WCH11_05530 [Bdellovibrio sp.]